MHMKHIFSSAETNSQHNHPLADIPHAEKRKTAKEGRLRRHAVAAAASAVALGIGLTTPLVHGASGSCADLNVSDYRFGFCYLDSNDLLAVFPTGTLIGTLSPTVTVGGGVDSAFIVNRGSIIGQSSGAGIINSGTNLQIVNSGTIVNPNAQAIIVNPASASITFISNESGGQIIGSTGINVIAGSIGTIDNQAGALIRGVNGDAIRIDSGQLSELNNAGELNGAVRSGSTTINLLGSQATISGPVVNPGGSINIRSGADFTAENTFDSATFLIESGGRLRVSGTAYALTVADPAAEAFNNAGTLDVAEGLQARITGNYTQSGTLRIGASSTSSYGQLRVTGNAVLTGTASFEVDVNTTNTLAAGQTLSDVISATGTLTNSAPANNVTDNSYLFDFTSATSGNGVDLQVVAATTAPAPAPAPAPPRRPRPPAPSPAPAPAPAPAPVGIVPAVIQSGLANGGPAAAVLDGFIRGGATGTDFDAVVTALGRLPNARSVALAVGQSMPALHGNAPAMLMSLGSSTSLAVQQQLQGDGGPTASLQEPSGANFGGGGGAGGRSDSGKGLWVKALGNRLNQDTVDGASGYKLSTYGLMGGLQSELNATTTLGFGLGYLDSDVAGQDFAAGQSSDIESVQLVGYGQYAIGDAGWQLNWQGDFTRSRVESERNITFIGRTAQAKYNGDAWHLGVGISKAYTVNPTTTVQPSVALDWRSFKAEGYTETGAGALNLQVNEQTAQEAVLKVGAQVQQQLTPQTQWLASAALGYDLRDQRDAVTARFTGGGVAFTTEGLPASRTLGELGLGIRHQASNGMEVVARYDLRLREGLRDQTASVRVNWAF